MQGISVSASAVLLVFFCVPAAASAQSLGETAEDAGVAIARLLDEHRDADALMLSEQARTRAHHDLLARGGLVDAAAPVSLASAGKGEVPRAAYASPALSSAADVASTARRLESSIVSYWVGDEELFIWLASGDGTIRSARVPVKRAVLAKTIAAADPASKTPDVAAFTRVYDWTIAPIAKYLPGSGGSLVIVPHRELFRVPFVALRNPRARKYLIEQFAISYAPSISSFAVTERLRRRPSSATGIMVVSDPKSMGGADRGDRLQTLTGSAREVAAVQHALAPSRVVVLSGTGALEVIVRRTFPGKRVVHFATHTVITDDAPLDSYLAVGAVGSESAADGRFRVREIYDVSLDAKLVFLSACGTAAGRASGDGMSTLAWAWFHAGAPAVVATLWNVSDEPRAKLAADFYTAWRRGMDRRAALRYAQLRMIKALRAGAVVGTTARGKVRLSNNPVYWASYVLIGEP